METLNYSGVMIVETCCNCQMKFAMDRQFYNLCRDTGESFYCPRGHAQHYTKSEIQKLQQEIKSQQESLTYLRNANANLHTKITEKNHEIRAQKAAKTRLKNRIKHGVCPCCNRTFQNLANHMATQHPTFTTN